MLKSAPAISIAIVFVPLFDTIKVFILRMAKGKHPFTPDKQHAHHTLLCLGLNHAQTTLYLVGLNAAFILGAFSGSYLGTTTLFFLLLVQKDRAGTKALEQHFQEQIDEALKKAAQGKIDHAIVLTGILLFQQRRGEWGI